MKNLNKIIPSKIISLLLMAIQLSTSTAQTCPTAGFDSLSNFDFDGFIQDRWYSIKQVPVIYQPISQFNCVYADYTKVKTTSQLCRLFGCKDPPTIKVFNSARRNSIDGRVNSINFEGTLTGESSSKAQVSFPLIPRPLRRGSNYWIVAAGKWTDLPSISDLPSSELTYDWAIITTGAPDSVGKDGKCFSNGGMWIFSKLNVPPENAVNDIESIATGLGLSTTEWLPVKQEGCQY